MEMITRNPASGVYPASPDYIHALEVRHPSRLLFVSGTMGLDQEGMAAADLERQLELIWSNLRAILTSADMTVDNIVRLTSYLSDGAFMEANQNARLRALGGRAVPTTAIIVETLRDDWLVEIEIIAAG
ncbi:enamine deaminase RidA [Rhizobium leguminosarum bv. trifolii]|jgi:enamine deaminase RidA (YjgF/YER057c/UK114 family)|uniref:Endoribonuclease L-PSP n=2 Tax=Rhizobium leguminosarum TaxID=384 RepID=A0A1B8R9V2_RHILT|nr:RidA family protein [Rhizobium leguminosarum]AOO91527.1 endoribonuclease L-PSP [Rhizobium leguminosarum bv. trifolii]ASS54782.1 RidA family protein [Rhizobium leguminosarum bv. viciae]AVC52466.1 endoribonuclease L-PSP family protein [Rhizobium leguminosarum bv. viciae]MBB4328074.1 enamine deaminase RidA (YjgF/YER057c/UK114 family) [Rhizobium leguminosarum]MBB4341776.1 enamine deaminase RidA (YjgF/YER057c/UK114 family) [Rhizobium leguminosarum]